MELEISFPHCMEMSSLDIQLNISFCVLPWEITSCRSGTTQRSANDDRTLIFWRAVPLTKPNLISSLNQREASKAWCWRELVRERTVMSFHRGLSLIWGQRDRDVTDTMTFLPVQSLRGPVVYYDALDVLYIQKWLLIISNTVRLFIVVIVSRIAH